MESDDVDETSALRGDDGESDAEVVNDRDIGSECDDM